MKTIHLQQEGASIGGQLILDQQMDGQNGILISSMPSLRKTRIPICGIYFSGEFIRNGLTVSGWQGNIEQG